VDNKAHIIEEIDKDMQNALQEIEQEYKEKLLEFEKALNQKLSKKIKALKEDIEIELSNIEKQRVNNFEFEQNQRILLKQNEIYAKVINKLKEKAIKNKKIIEIMIKILEKNSDKKIKEFLVPKSLETKKSSLKPTLDEFKVIGVISKDFSMEIEFNDFLENNQNELNMLITKELF